MAVVLTMAGVTSMNAAEPRDPVGLGELPRYLFFHKAPGAGGPFGWNQAEPGRFTAGSLRQMVDTLGTRGGDQLRIGAAFTFSLLENDFETLRRSLEALLGAAREADVPVFICLDGQNWWQGRPDLWNWWDPSRPGFNPANRVNVEWTDWGPEHAIQVSWRNWGKQHRVAPAPNLFAPRVQAEVRQKLARCTAVIVRWHRQLPKDRKYLFGGIKVGWEASINVNAYHFIGGNRIFEQNPTDASKDPTTLDLARGFTFGNACLGYAAATSAGLKPEGELTIKDHEMLVARYLAGLSRTVRSQGVPAHLIFTHQGGTYAPWDKHLSFRPAINDDSIPGWSFYSHDPQDCGSLAADLEAAGRKQWAAVEWLRGGKDKQEWREHLARTLAFKQCRLVSVYNWEGVEKNKDALAAVRELVESEEADLTTKDTKGTKKTEVRSVK